MPELEQKRMTLAHRLAELTATDDWKNVVIPYLVDERNVLIETMASQTDAMQLMRYAGSVQTLNSLIYLERRTRQVIEQGMEKKLQQFKN